MQTFAQSLIFYAFLSMLLPLTAALVRHRVLVKGMRSVIWFCALTFALECLGTILWLTKTSNLWIGHVHSLMEFLLLANMYRVLLKDFLRPWLIPVLMILFTSFSLINSFFLQDLKAFNSYVKISEAILLMSLALIFFYRLLKELRVTRLEHYPFFWINSGLLLYFASSLFVFLYSNYTLLYSVKTGIFIWFIHALFYMLFNLFIAIGIWVAPLNRNLPG